MSANGQLRADELVEVESGVRLATRTAQAWKRLVAAAYQEANLSVWVAKPYGGYRDLAAQRALYTGASAGNPLSTVRISAPGTSTHGDGTRVDVGSFYGMRETWMLRNAYRFGFTREFGANDPNHFRHDGTTAAAATATPIEVPAQEAEMKIIQQQSRGIAVVGAGYFKGITGEELPYALELWGAPKVFPDGDATSVGARQFDLAKAISLNGVAADDIAHELTPAEITAAVNAAKTLTVPVDTQAIIAGVIAGMPRGATPEEIAKAVIAEIAS